MTKSSISLTPKKNRPVFITVTGGKGGVGKSFVSISLAFLYQMLGKKTVLIDGDLGLAKTHQLLVMSALNRAELEQFKIDAADYQGRIRTIKEMVDEEYHELSPEFFVNHPAGIRLLRGIKGTAEVSLSPANPKDRKFVKSLLDLEDAEVVLFDTGAGIGSNVGFFVSLADYVLLITNPTPTAYTDCYATVKSIIASTPVPPPFFLVMNNVRKDETPQANLYINNLLSNISRFLGQNFVPLLPFQNDKFVPHLSDDWNTMNLFLKQLTHHTLCGQAFSKQLFTAGSVGYKLREAAFCTAQLGIRDNPFLEQFSGG